MGFNPRKWSIGQILLSRCVYIDRMPEGYWKARRREPVFLRGSAGSRPNDCRDDALPFSLSMFLETLTAQMPRGDFAFSPRPDYDIKCGKYSGQRTPCRIERSTPMLPSSGAGKRFSPTGSLPNCGTRFCRDPGSGLVSRPGPGRFCDRRSGKMRSAPEKVLPLLGVVDASPGSLLRFSG